MGSSRSYLLRAYPAAREGVVFPAAWAGARVSLANTPLGQRAPMSPEGLSSVLDIPSQLVVKPEGDSERRTDNLRRSTGRIRRYVVANDLRVLLTTTYSDDYLERAGDRQRVMADGALLVRLLRRSWGEHFPYLLTVEAQPQRSAARQSEVFNTMMIIPSLPRPVFDHVRREWSYGSGDGYNGVDFTRWKSSGRAASYASKSIGGYASKGLGAAPAGVQAYRVAEGFQPQRVEVALDPHNSSVEAAQSWAAGAGVTVEAFHDLRESERPGDACWLSWAAA